MTPDDRLRIPDRVARLYRGRTRLKLKVLPSKPDEGPPMLQFEGDATSLDFLVKVLEAVGCGAPRDWLVPEQHLVTASQAGLVLRLLADRGSANPAAVRRRRSRLALRFETGSGRRRFVVEGDRAALEQLADLVRDVLTDPDCGRQIHVGQGGLAKSSEMGLYIHRLPCMAKFLRQFGWP